MDHEAETDPQDLYDTDAAGLAEALLPSVIRLHDGDRLDLAIHPVRKTIAGRGAAHARLQRLDPRPDAARRPRGGDHRPGAERRRHWRRPSHWHGLRLENRYDGVPHETQTPIPIGGTFTYKLQFPDPGVYWYHPHIREDYGQEMGLYGTIVVEPADAVVLAPGRPRVRHAHPGRRAHRGRTDRAVPPLGRDPHRDGPVRQRHADQRRDPASPARPRWARSCASTSSNTANTRIFNVAAPRRADEARRRRQRPLRARDVRRRGDARAVGAGRHRRAVRDGRATCALEHRTPDTGLRPRRGSSVAGTSRRRRRRVVRDAARRPRAVRRARGDSRHDLEREPDKTLAFFSPRCRCCTATPDATASVYACPMHPEVTATEPATLPEVRDEAAGRRGSRRRPRTPARCTPRSPATEPATLPEVRDEAGARRRHAPAGGRTSHGSTGMRARARPRPRRTATASSGRT